MILRMKTLKMKKSQEKKTANLPYVRLAVVLNRRKGLLVNQREISGRSRALPKNPKLVTKIPRTILQAHLKSLKRVDMIPPRGKHWETRHTQLIRQTKLQRRERLEQGEATTPMEIGLIMTKWKATAKETMVKKKETRVNLETGIKFRYVQAAERTNFRQ